MLDKTEGIVIRTLPYGESHIILTLYTKEKGKLAVMAKGAKKTKSPFAAIAQPFVHGQFSFHYRKTMSTLSQGEIINPFRHLRMDIEKAAYAAYVVEILDLLTNEREASPALFRFVLAIVTHLEEGEDPEVLARIFDLKMTALAGVRPELDRCARCGSTEGRFSFSVRAAGFLCETCAPSDPYRFELSSQQVQLMRKLYYVDVARLGRIEVRPESKDLLKKVMESYYDTYVGLYLKSKHFLDQWENWRM